MWQALLIGPVLIAAGIWEYERLAAFDARGGVIYVDKFTAFLYAIGGKTTVLVITSGIGVGYCALLWHWWRSTRAAERRLAEMTAEPTPDTPPARRAPPVGPALRQVPRAASTPGDGDPFRSPPSTAVKVVRTERPAPKPAVVDTGADDGPRILR